MPAIPFGSPVLSQVCPPSALDSTAPPPLSPTVIRPSARCSGVLPDTQHSPEAVGQARLVNTLPAGNPLAWTVDQASPPLSETTRETPAAPGDNGMAIHVSELLHERVTGLTGEVGTEGTMAGAQLSPLSVL